MSLTTEFVPLELEHLRREAAIMKHDGWRFIQTHAVYTDDGVDLYYSFMKDGHIVNYWIKGVQKGTPVPSITDIFLAAFVFENEARELFGVDMRDIAIDFAGAMYAPAVNEPMTIISPEQKAAKDKALKAAAKASEKASANRESGASSASEKPAAATMGGRRVFIMTPERQARLDAKLPTLSDDKRAKVEAALKARAAEAEAASSAPASAPQDKPAAEEKAVEADESATPSAPSTVDAELEQKIAALSPEKAAKVRAALGGGEPAACANAEEADANPTETSALANDDQVNALVGNMDEAKAAIIRAALAVKGGE